MDKIKEKTEDIKNQIIGTSKEETKTQENRINKGIACKILNPIRLTLQTIIWTLIIILIILLILATASKKTDIFGHRLYIILSGSMEPTIHIKQAIITEETDNPQVGDIIAFGEGDFITVHRIIKDYTEGENKLYQTKGDNNNTEDKELVKQSQVKGKVKYILPLVGDAILFLQSHVYVLIIAIGVLLMIILVRRLI